MLLKNVVLPAHKNVDSIFTCCYPILPASLKHLGNGIKVDLFMDADRALNMSTRLYLLQNILQATKAMMQSMVPCIRTSQ